MPRSASASASSWSKPSQGGVRSSAAGPPSSTCKQQVAWLQLQLLAAGAPTVPGVVGRSATPPAAQQEQTRLPLDVAAEVAGQRGRDADAEAAQARADDARVARHAEPVAQQLQTHRVQGGQPAST